MNAAQRVTYWREGRALEVDGVLDGSWGRWAIEVKTGRFTGRDLRGLLEFARRHPQVRPLVLCERESLGVAREAGIDAQPWEEFLLDGPAR